MPQTGRDPLEEPLGLTCFATWTIPAMRVRTPYIRISRYNPPAVLTFG
jgi:hypothetical protein